MSLPTMKAFKWAYKIDPDTGFNYYDILNEYETDPLEVIRSKIIIRLSTAKGEWAEDLDFGIPISSIKQNNTQPDVIAQLIADEILKVENVNGVKLSVKDFNTTTRVFTGSYIVTTIYGETTVEATV